MYNFSQLILRNGILAIIFSITVATVAFFSTKNSVQSKQDNIVESIRPLAVELLTTSDIETLGNIIKANKEVKSVVIKSPQTEATYNFTRNTTEHEFNFLLPASSQFSLKQSNTQITIQAHAITETAFIIQLCLTILVVSTICMFIAAGFSQQRSKGFFKKINLSIKKELSLLTEKEVADTQDVTIEIPELKQGIVEIKQLISEQKSDTHVLEKEAYIDSLTGLDNRNRFVHYFESKVSSGETKFGALLITRCSELQTVNQIHGYHEGDNYIKQVSEILNSTIVTYKGAQLFRLNSSDFATILPNVTLPQAEKYAKELSGKFNEYQQASDLDSVAYTGIVSITGDKPLGELLALADTGISVAQTQQINSWFCQKDADILNSSSANYGNQNWRQEIEYVLENQRVTLLVQNIQPTNRNSRVYGEVLARFLNTSDDMLPTASFIAMAEKLDKIVAVDRLIIETAINSIKEKNLLEHSFGINISARSIHDEHFLIWLERKLLRETSVASKLIFEISEYGLQQNIKSSKRFIDMIHRAGARITVERFGVGLTSFKFFRDLKPDFIKMDSTYTRDIDEDKNNQYFLRLMVDLAHRLSINVLAESVESQEEKHTLEKLFIDGCQGFYIGKPTSL